MTYPEAIRFLYDLRLFGLKLGLENTFKLARLAGNPHEQLRFIHVAGTNGKGSTCAMLESVYRHAGLRVGLFTSPHLVSFGERIQVNRQPAGEADITRLVADLRTFLTAFPITEHPTFFEVVTVMALRYFVAQHCDLVIWETGMGGRLDATNIVAPLAAVITNVQFDHQKWLGNTLEEIATEKAGIIKPGVPVITAATEPEAVRVITQTAQHRGSPLTAVASADMSQPPLDRIQLPLLGDHQRLNAALAVATVRALERVLPVSPPALEDGLRHVQWAGRLQRIQTPTGQTILVDGAHNTGGVQTLCTTLRSHFADPRRTLVLGILGDKDWPDMCRALAPMAGKIVLVPVRSERTASPNELSKICHQANPGAEILACPHLADALRVCATDPFILITGSLYLVGEALELLNAVPRAGPGERDLNEYWGGSHQP